MLVDEAVYIEGIRHEGHDPDGTTGFSWVGILDPTADELVDYQHHFHFNDLALEDAVARQQRPKLDSFEDHDFLVTKTVSYDSNSREISIGDVCIFYSERTVVTVRHGEAMPLKTIRADLEAHPEKLKLGTTAVIHEILDRLVDQYVEVSSRICADVDDLEDVVFSASTSAPPRLLYTVKREVVEFRRAVLPLLDPITHLASGSARFIDKQQRFQFSDVRDHLLKVIDLLDSTERIVDATLQASIALVSVQQNADMRRISAWVGIAAVPTMLAGVYGMNFENMPELQTRWGYYVVVAIMASACGLLFRLFRRNKWL
ncbi:MAG: magnesium and cobalt transport protein CorA [Actinobacteria bacterium]|jgi:magnesium transporter|nr:magnesium and cobalt transport protein CorA [Actinomycetota bacterium]NBP53236.1 magnesium and cobalt transport protein CorA [Actinomycetota bacterium]